MNILYGLSAFDWITPVVQIVQCAFGMTTIDATVDGWTGNEVKQALEAAGVSCGAGMIVDNMVILTVDDAELAEVILDRLRAGVPTQAAPALGWLEIEKGW